MASRAVWTGQLRLSLVSIPVEIHAATERGARVSFRQIHGPSGQPVRYEKTVPGIGPVDPDEILKGYDLGGDEYLLLEPDDLDAIRLETKRTLELVQFVRAGEIAPLYYNRPYFVLPSEPLSEDAYRVVRDALRQADKVGLGQLTMRGKEYLCALRPCGDGLLLETLHYADEIRDAAPIFAGIADAPSDEELLAVATQLIDRKTAPFDAAAFTDHYDAALRDLIEEKRKSGETPRAASGGGDARKGGQTVTDLMEALQRSVAQSDGRGRGRRKQAAPKSPAGASGKSPAGKSPARGSSAKSDARSAAARGKG